jgi:hypothetical protein
MPQNSIRLPKHMNNGPSGAFMHLDSRPGRVLGVRASFGPQVRGRRRPEPDQALLVRAPMVVALDFSNIISDTCDGEQP